MTVISKTRALLAGAAIAVVGTALAVAAPAIAAPKHPAVQPVTTGSYYLALGDSVPFGYREANSQPAAPDYTKATNFRGYPEIVGNALGLKVVNASCPGETSSSFINIKKQSNGCEASSTGVAAAGYRTNFPLHASYVGSQLTYASNFLKKYGKQTKLITLMIGANDGFICQQNTTDGCTSPSEILPVVKKITANVKTIVGKIRGSLGYKGQIVIVNYYSTDYTNSTNGGAQQAGASAINNGLDTGASGYHVSQAATYAAFQRAAEQTSGDDCTAGLLTQLTGGGCGVHPSVAGQNLIALQVIKAIRK